MNNMEIVQLVIKKPRHNLGGRALYYLSFIVVNVRLSVFGNFKSRHHGS